ncbi:MAG: GIY-YIG nuclease family protein [Candidatus Eisenbacteria bacterium]|uniref:GIY-YIG nuclease family protein n=1 Tax=Eiseniibacteriota bacterium TaxID=2212470 RepID=A0A956RP95_UNCEI|nr:GIY-YIG nuclease family protein [Candidatus Eisenbacteria bacterium]
MRSKRGHVYVLTTQNSELVKIGGTDHPPMKRIREINAAEPYRGLGPWTLYDFREVHDWRKVEYDMHYAFRSKQSRTPRGQKELFRIAPHRVRARLNALDPEQIVSKPKIDRMFQDELFAGFLTKLFSFTGILNWLDIQGAWTFTLFPGTSGGRYYTINIGRHEVAFASLPDPAEKGSYHSIVMDCLVLDFPDVRKWVRRHRGTLRNDVYASALPRSVSVGFWGSFVDAHQFLELDGVRRALLAYWSEGLIVLKERGAGSVHSRHHNWNAVAELRSRIAPL